MEGKKEMNYFLPITNGMIIGSGLCLLYEMFIGYGHVINVAGFFILSIICRAVIGIWEK
jgi:hypothetical protein